MILPLGYGDPFAATHFSVDLFARPALAGLRVILMQPPAAPRIPVRRHRKARVAKKWRKRYGLRDDPSVERPDLSKVIVDNRQGIIYCYPQTWEAIKAEAEKINAEIRRLGL